MKGSKRRRESDLEVMTGGTCCLIAHVLLRDLFLNNFRMGIFRAIGLGMLLIILGFLVPEVLKEAERTAVLFLRGAGASALTATELIEQASSSPSSSGTTTSPRRLVLPKAPQPVPF